MKPKNNEIKFSRFNLERFFNSILIEGEMGFGKPEEEVYKRAMKELGLGPDEVWAVGDNLEWDVGARKNWGYSVSGMIFQEKGFPPVRTSSRTGLFMISLN